MLKGRQEFFDHIYAASKRRVRNARHRLAEAKDHLAAHHGHIKVYKNILNAEISRHSHDLKHLKKRSAIAKGAVTHIDLAISHVKNWTPKGKALIQTSLNEISASYLQIQDLELVAPTELLETAHRDHKVKRRLLQWLSILRVQVLAAKFSLKSLRHRRVKLYNKIEKALASLIKNLGLANRAINRLIVVAGQTIKSHEELLRLFGKLVAQNKQLVVASRNYCNVEAANFGKNKARIHGAIKLFREIRKYFIDHFSSIHGYIRAKFNHHRD
jgi:hypothetical protein